MYIVVYVAVAIDYCARLSVHSFCDLHTFTDFFTESFERRAVLG
jgi:hypothetical protein